MTREPKFPHVPALLAYRIKSSPNDIAFTYPHGDSGWQSRTWAEVGHRVDHIAAGLLVLGLKPEERCAIIANTRFEWIMADLGIVCAAGATTTVYPSNTAEECTYILNDSSSRFVFVEDQKQLDKLLGSRHLLPDVAAVITITPCEYDILGWVMSLDDLEELGRDHIQDQPQALRLCQEQLTPSHLATLIYTSGTTGRPKGVELLHRAWTFEAQALAETGVLYQDDHQFLWLPLSHVFGKVLLGFQLHVGFRTTVDGRIPKIVDNLAVIRPTFMAAAPRIFEKVYNKVVTGAKQGGPVKWNIFRWAVGIGRKVSAIKQQGNEPSGLLRIQYAIADKLVFSKLKARFGGRIRFFVSGSAPLSREMAEFFHAAGILILEGYGLTESCAASFINRPDTFAFGTVGEPLDGVEVKIAPEDGEILLRGPGIMQGYHNMPEATAESFTPDGWLRTGDIGELDSRRRLKITDRKKDLIKTSGGKYVAPQHIEGRLKSLSPFLSQVLVHGNNRNFCSALVTLDPDALAHWAKEQGLNEDYETLTHDKAVLHIVQNAVDELNSGLASYETIKKFAVLPHDLSIEEGELTPSLKVKRKVVETKYAEVIEDFYKGSLTAV